MSSGPCHAVRLCIATRQGFWRLIYHIAIGLTGTFPRHNGVPTWRTRRCQSRPPAYSWQKYTQHNDCNARILIPQNITITVEIISITFMFPIFLFIAHVVHMDSIIGLTYVETMSCITTYQRLFFIFLSPSHLTRAIHLAMQAIQTFWMAWRIGHTIHKDCRLRLLLESTLSIYIYIYYND